MSVTARCLAISCLLFTLSAISFSQKTDPEAKAALATGAIDYAQKAPMNVKRFRPVLTVRPGTVFDATTGAVISNVGSGPGNAPNNKSAVTISTTPIASFDGSFLALGGPNKGGLFPFTMLGGHPALGRTTNIGGKISEVSLILRNADNSVLTVVSYAPFEDLTLQSPNFATTNYGSGQQIQFADAVQRAEFFNTMASNWHTNLQPTVTNRAAVFDVPRFVPVRLSNGHVVQARSYFIGTAADGNTFVLMLDILFDFFFGNEVNQEITDGNFTSDSLNMTLLPNTFLFSLNANKPDTPGTCCVGGFHTVFFDPDTTPSTRWVTQFASWVSPGLFSGGTADVTAISHETSEAFNDPFLDNITPIWQFPGQPPKSRVCQGGLETGDPIEGLPVATVPITLMVDGQSFTFHPQTEALLQWFQMGDSSNAIDDAFSFPDESALLSSAVPCPNN
jgi:hypothetical protein